MTDAHTALLLQEFKALSACFDLNPRSIQRAGRNTLIKDGHTMWVSALAPNWPRLLLRTYMSPPTTALRFAKLW